MISIVIVALQIIPFHQLLRVILANLRLTVLFVHIIAKLALKMEAASLACLVIYSIPIIAFNVHFFAWVA
jgi:hypothetical protein